MSNFRDVLKPGAAHNGARAAHVAGYYAVLRHGKRIIWNGDATYRSREYGADAKQMAIEEAEAALRCDAGSLMAEQLQAAMENPA